MEDEFSLFYNPFMLINMYCLKQNNVNNMKTNDENTLKLCFTQIYTKHKIFGLYHPVKCKFHILSVCKNIQQPLSRAIHNISELCEQPSNHYISVVLITKYTINDARNKYIIIVT